MGFLNFFGEKPVPNKLYTLEEVMKMMEKYGDTYDFPATEKDDEIGFMAVPKRQVEQVDSMVQEQNIAQMTSSNKRKEHFKNRISDNGKLRDDSSKYYEEGRKYGDYQRNSKKYQKWVDNQR